MKILGHGAFRKRVMEMGFVKGREITLVLNAPLQDPIKFHLMDYEVSLRRSEAQMIEIEPLEEWEHEVEEKIHVTPISNPQETKKISKAKTINIALVGNPNCGKTSLFNIVSGAHEHVGNYAGVTVGAKEGHMKYKGYEFNVVDLPGTYSLSAYSPEELYVMRYLKEETPDVIVNVVVASNLERNLFLTTELIDMNRSMVSALNMFDELEKKHIKLEHEMLGGMLGVPIIPTIAATGWGIDKLLDTIIEVYELQNPHTRHIHIKMRSEIEDSVRKLVDALKEDSDLPQRFSPRFLAIKLLEKDPEMKRMLEKYPNYRFWEQIRDNQNSRLDSECSCCIQP